VTDQGEGKPKIIIDEDWKNQVQAEKELLASQQAEDAKQPNAAVGLPPASLATLLTTLATQTLMELGQVPNPLTGEAQVDLEQAKFFIDTIQVVEDKTKGNCTPDEALMLENVLHQLRLAYVAAGSPVAGPPVD
jgi:hypothetical protein